MTVQTIKETERFALLEDRLQGVGCWQRKADGKTTLWETGTDWQITKDYLLTIDDSAFDEEASWQDFS